MDDHAIAEPGELLEHLLALQVWDDEAGGDAEDKTGDYYDDGDGDEDEGGDEGVGHTEDDHAVAEPAYKPPCPAGGMMRVGRRKVCGGVVMIMRAMVLIFMLILMLILSLILKIMMMLISRSPLFVLAFPPNFLMQMLIFMLNLMLRLGLLFRMILT